MPLNELGLVLKDKLPHIALLLLVFYVFVKLYSDSKTIKEIFHNIFHVGSIIAKHHYKNERRKYDQNLYEPKYIEWQKDAIDILYSDLLKQQDIHFSTLCFENASSKITEEYESISIPVDPLPYPFKNLCNKNELRTVCFNPDQESQKGIQKSKCSKVQWHYYKMVRDSIRYPKRIGYMLDNICMESYSKYSVCAHSGMYEDNVLESHFLEYELYKAFCKTKKLKQINKVDLLSLLPQRKRIHDSFIQKYNDESRVLLSGEFRESLLGVQMLVLVRNYNNSYDLLRIRRSSDVAAKPGYLQFVPSGGFEAIGDGTDFDTQWDNYSIKKALFRELLEECFGIDEDDAKFSSNSVSPDRIYQNTKIKELVAMLDKEGQPNAKLEFCGFSMNLVGLRQELCFILVIEDSQFASQLISNYESRHAIHLIDILNIENPDFWKRKKIIKNPDSNKKLVDTGAFDEDLKVLNCTSAGLLELCRKTNIYQIALAKAKAAHCC